ncbi:TetR/AcrR family transcriptional regulator [Nonomuraea rhizosphaerae]|uniref:TetR/AcrR family transcriptional regulator n=1 Tax=Nonomuraea rhizosphaerae TaxID=2665663 RepID=UPI001C6079DC|nr:TetR/AcrR family transcriptional regulator [Nonomuraea rhizosphaerae]
MRADAARNREQIVQAARAVFTQDGPAASLNQVAQRAGVGPGTLYRHFPTLQDLLVAVIKDDVSALCARGRELLTGPSPEQALRTWLRAVAGHASAMRGLVATQLAAVTEGSALAACHDEITATGAALLARTGSGLDIADLLKLANAIGWAGEQAPGDQGLTDRLLALVTLS